MKKVLIIFMALATFAVNAQKKDSERKENRKELKANLTPDQRADLKMKKMTLALDLNDSQQQKVKQLFLKAENDRTVTSANRSEMTDTQKYEAKSAMIDRRIAMKKEMKQILTEEQMTKWDHQQGDRRGKSRGKRNPESKSQH